MRVLLDRAIEAVPAVKYALGMAGVAAAVAIVAGLFKDTKIAVLGSIIMLGLMFMLVVFAQFAKNAASNYRPLALVLAWAFVILTVATSAFIFTSFFFSWPRPLEGYIGNVEKPISATPELTGTKPARTVEGAPTPLKGRNTKGPPLPSNPLTTTDTTRDGADRSFRFTVRLLVPPDMSDAQVTVNGAPATVINRLPTAILVSVKSQKINTMIRLSGKRECGSIEQLIDRDQTLPVNCR